MKIKKNIITPYITFLFITVGLSGIFMLFHVFDEYTRTVHEILGLIFVLFSVLHIIINWESLKSHFKTKTFITSAIIVLLLSIGFIILGKAHGGHKRIIMEKLYKAPLSNVFSIFDVEYNEAVIILKNHNITIGSSKTIKEVSKNNKKSPKKILELITNRSL